MIVIIILLTVALVILLSLLLLAQKEQRKLANEINWIRKEQSSQLLHQTSGLVSNRLIEEINGVLRELRNEEIQLKRRQGEVNLMMTNISHDLRTPLTSALGYMDMIMHSNMPEEERIASLEIIEKRLFRLNELIDSFFEFSKVIAKEEPPKLDELNLVSVLEEAISHYYDDYCDRNRMIVFHCPENRIMIHSNKNMLMRIFDNLIGNALKHGMGNLTITVQKDSFKILFSNELLDKNVDVNRIFEEFYTTDISRTKGNTGLGLAIAKQFTELLGMKIHAVVEDGVICFEIS